MDVFLDGLLNGKCGDSSPLMQLAEEVDYVITKRRSWGSAGEEEKGAENGCPSSTRETGRHSDFDGREWQAEESLATQLAQDRSQCPKSEGCPDSYETVLDSALGSAADGERGTWQQQRRPDHDSTVDDLYLARSLFVVDPLPLAQQQQQQQVWPNTSRLLGATAQLPHSLCGPLWEDCPDGHLCSTDTREEVHAHPHRRGHGHDDDCTPSSGLDYLIAVQNPTWEAAVYTRLLLTLHSLHNTAAAAHSRPGALEHLSRSFPCGMVQPKDKECGLPADPLGQIANHLAAAANLVSAGRIVEAIPLLELVTKTQSSIPDAWMLLALARYFAQNDTAAISSCKRYISLPRGSPDSSSSMVLLLLATCLSNEGDLPAMHSVLFHWMIEHLGLTDELVRRFLPVEEDTATLGDVKICRLLIGICQSFLAPRHNDGSLQWALAILEFSQGNYAVAGRHFESVLQQNPASPSVLNQIGACLHNLRQFDRALHLQDRVLAVCPDFPRAHYNKALTLFTTGDSMTALRLLQTGLNLQRSHNVEEAEQFWYLAARIIPRLPAHVPVSDGHSQVHVPEQHRLRVKLMSAVLARDVQLYRALLDDMMRTLASSA